MERDKPEENGPTFARFRRVRCYADITIALYDSGSKDGYSYSKASGSSDMTRQHNCNTSRHPITTFPAHAAIVAGHSDRLDDICRMVLGVDDDDEQDHNDQHDDEQDRDDQHDDDRDGSHDDNFYGGSSSSRKRRRGHHHCQQQQQQQQQQHGTRRRRSRGLPTVRLGVPAADVAVVERCFDFFYTEQLEGMSQQDTIRALLFADYINAPRLMKAAAHSLVSLPFGAMEVGTALDLICLPSALKEGYGDLGQALRVATQRMLCEYRDLQELWSAPAKLKAFIRLPFETVLELISSQALKAHSENTVCVTVAAWLQQQERDMEAWCDKLSHQDYEARRALMKENATRLCKHLHVFECSGSFLADALPRLPVLGEHLLPSPASARQLMYLAHLCPIEQYTAAHLISDGNHANSAYPWATGVRQQGDDDICGHLTFSVSIPSNVLRKACRAIKANSYKEPLHCQATHFWAGYLWTGVVDVVKQEPDATAAAAATAPPKLNLYVGIGAVPCGGCGPEGEPLPLSVATNPPCPLLFRRQGTMSARGGSGYPVSKAPPGVVPDGIIRGCFDLFPKDPETGDAAWERYTEEGQLTVTFTLPSPDCIS